MTEEHKQEERDCKIQTIAELNSLRETIFTTHEEVFNCDVRLKDYVCMVIDNPDDHNLYELLAVKRFFYLLDKYEFRTKHFLNFVRFYESLKFSGTQGRTRYKLTPIQTFQYANLFGLYDPRDDSRLVRDAYIFVPRKFSKSTSSAAIAIYDMFCGDANGQVFCGANSYQQAKVLFDEIRKVLKSMDPLGRHFKVNREIVEWADGRRESFCRCLASNAETLDGLYASTAIFDEYAQARDTASHNGDDFKNTITTSMGPRKSPLTVVITTASEVIDGPCAREISGAKRVLKGELENDNLFASLFMPDVDDQDNDPHTWAKVHPHLGVTVNQRFYEYEYAKAQMSASLMLAFRTKLLNKFVINEDQVWMAKHFIKDHMVKRELTDYQTREDAMIAIDLSESDDFSAVTVAVYEYDRKMYYFHTSYFFPRGALEGHRNRRMYEIWAEQGHLTLTEGDVIDYEVIVNYVLSINTPLKTIKIGYDSWKSKEVINRLETAIGVHASHVLTPIPQTYGPFNAPVEVFEHGLKTGKIEINDNPINLFCFANAVIDVDNMDNKKPIKRGTGRGHQNTNANKIDGVITMLMCERLFIDAKR